MINGIAILFLTQLPDKLCQIIADKSVIVGKMLRSEFRDFPSRQIAVHTV